MQQKIKNCDCFTLIIIDHQSRHWSGAIVWFLVIWWEHFTFLVWHSKWSGFSCWRVQGGLTHSRQWTGGLDYFGYLQWYCKHGIYRAFGYLQRYISGICNGCLVYTEFILGQRSGRSYVLQRGKHWEWSKLDMSVYFLVLCVWPPSLTAPIASTLIGPHHKSTPFIVRIRTDKVTA